MSLEFQSVLGKGTLTPVFSRGVAVLNFSLFLVRNSSYPHRLLTWSRSLFLELQSVMGKELLPPSSLVESLSLELLSVLGEELLPPSPPMEPLAVS